MKTDLRRWSRANENPDAAVELVIMREEWSLSGMPLPAEIEPPHADFFNAKILQQVQREEATEERELEDSSLDRAFQMDWVPIGAAAMALCFC